ncbi:unnamed protein product [Aphanomyces euteiches]
MSILCTTRVVWIFQQLWLIFLPQSMHENNIEAIASISIQRHFEILAMTKKLVLPVPQGFFRCPPLTPAAKRRYVRHGQRALVDLVQKSQLRNGPIEWTLDHETSGVRVYRGHDPETSSLVYLNVTDIHATLEEAAALMSAGDGSRDYCATYLDNILDAQPLYTITTRTEDHPHNAVTIKWRVLSSKSALVRNRDMVVLEIQDDFT